MNVQVPEEEAKMLLEMLRKRLADYALEIGKTKELIRQIEQQIEVNHRPKPGEPPAKIF